MVAKNTLPIQFRRNYNEAPFDDMVFTTTLSLTAWLTSPTRYAGQKVVLDEAGVITEYILNSTKDAWLPAGGGSGGGALTADINVLDVSIGQYNDGDVIPDGTDFEEIFNKMLTKVIPPTYVAPTVTLAGSGTLNVEAGTSINPTLTPTFTQNDGGATNDYDLLKASISIYNNATAAAHADGPYTIGDENIDYQASLDFDDGAIKNDNTGAPDATGQILAGTVVSNTVIYRGQRKAFYGVDGDIVNIRSNSLNRLNPANGTVFTLTGVSGGSLVIAYPATLRDLTQASFTSAGFTFDVLSEFVREADQSVNNAAAASPITYKVFRYDPVADFTTANFTVTI